MGPPPPQPTQRRREDGSEDREGQLGLSGARSRDLQGSGDAVRTIWGADRWGSDELRNAAGRPLGSLLGRSFPRGRGKETLRTWEAAAEATTDLKRMQEIGPDSRGGPSGQRGALEAASSSRRHLRREPGRPALGEDAFGMKPLREGTSPTPRPGGQPQTGHGSSPGPAETPVPWERVPSWGGPTPEGG